MVKDAEEPEPSKPPPMTTKEFEEELKKLTDRAKAAGVRTGRGIVSAFLSETLVAIDHLLERIEGEPEKPKRKPKSKTPRPAEKKAPRA